MRILLHFLYSIKLKKPKLYIWFDSVCVTWWPSAEVWSSDLLRAGPRWLPLICSTYTHRKDHQGKLYNARLLYTMTTHLSSTGVSCIIVWLFSQSKQRQNIFQIHRHFKMLLFYLKTISLLWLIKINLNTQFLFRIPCCCWYDCFCHNLQAPALSPN